MARGRFPDFVEHHLSDVFNLEFLDFLDFLKVIELTKTSAVVDVLHKLATLSMFNK